MVTTPQPHFDGPPPLRGRCGPAITCAILGVILFTVGGCSSSLSRWVDRTIARDSWLADYDSAEERARETGRDLLIVYLDDRPGVEHAMKQTLNSEPFKHLPADTHVCCTLVRSYEPDRRYVAQYGIERAPALILIHPDGTYHSANGTLSADEIINFFEASRPPGKTPTINPYVPREARYSWLKSLNEAVALSEETERAMVAVFYRPYSRDWRKMKKMLSTHEVYLRLCDLVPVKIGEFGRHTKASITRFGALRLPALVIAQPSGTYAVLERPASADAIVRFADAALLGTQRTTVNVVASPVELTPSAQP